MDCGASTTGRCPVLNGSSYSTLSTDVNIQNRTTNDTPAPLSGSGCASGTSGDPCRFAAESTANALNVRLVPASDWSNSGPRNELAKLRTTSSNDGIVYGTDVVGQSRYYSITLVVPSSTNDFPAPSTYSSGKESHGSTFWQILPVGACGPDQMSMLAIRRVDAGGNNHHGNDWQFTYWVKDSYLGNSTRVWPATGAGTTALTRGVEYNFVIRRYFPTGDPKGLAGRTDLWVNGSHAVTTYGSIMYAWPSSDQCGSEYWTPRTAGTDMPQYVKVGSYGNVNMLGTYGLRASDVRHGTTCAAVWTAGGTPCP